MPDLDQIKQGEQRVRDRWGRFPKGWSGPSRRYHGYVKRDEGGTWCGLL